MDWPACWRCLQDGLWRAVGLLCKKTRRRWENRSLVLEDTCKVSCSCICVCIRGADGQWLPGTTAPALRVNSAVRSYAWHEPCASLRFRGSRDPWRSRDPFELTPVMVGKRGGMNGLKPTQAGIVDSYSNITNPPSLALVPW